MENCSEDWSQSIIWLEISIKLKTLHKVNVLKFRTLFSFCSQIIGLEFTIWLSQQQTGKTLIRLLLHKQFDLGMRCLSYGKLFRKGNSKFKNIYCMCFLADLSSTFKHSVCEQQDCADMQAHFSTYVK